jgi:hypothetical protein
VYRTPCMIYVLLKFTEQSLLVRLMVLAAASVKVTVSWDVERFSLIEFNLRFRESYYLHNQCHHPEDIGSRILRNVFKFYAAICYNIRSRRQLYSACSS